MTALMKASASGHIRVVKALLAKGADINAKDNECHTALWSASRACQVDSVKTLLDNGADVNAR